MMVLVIQNEKFRKSAADAGLLSTDKIQTRKVSSVFSVPIRKCIVDSTSLAI